MNYSQSLVQKSMCRQVGTNYYLIGKQWKISGTSQTSD